MFYAGKQHHATQVGFETRRFHCAACGYSRRLKVMGVGEGMANNPYFLDGAGATQRASGRATDSYNSEVSSTLGLIRCPKCQARNKASVRAFYKGQLFRGALESFLAAGALSAYAILREFPEMFAIAAVFLVMGPAVRFFMARQRMEEMTTGVVWLDEDQQRSPAASREGALPHPVAA